MKRADIETRTLSEINNRWIIEEYDGTLCKYRYRCPDCNDWQTYGQTPYCPYCGSEIIKPLNR